SRLWGPTSAVSCAVACHALAIAAIATGEQQAHGSWRSGKTSVILCRLRRPSRLGCSRVGRLRMGLGAGGRLTALVDAGGSGLSSTGGKADFPLHWRGART